MFGLLWGTEGGVYWEEGGIIWDEGGSAEDRPGCQGGGGVRKLRELEAHGVMGREGGARHCGRFRDG